MFKITNVSQLGTDYTVADRKGNIIKSIQVINHYDIFEAALGEYTEDFDSYKIYLKQSVSKLSGFEDLDPTKVLWHSYSEELNLESLTKIIEYAVKHGYDKIILEYMLELDN